MIIPSEFDLAELIGNHNFGIYGKRKKKCLRIHPPHLSMGFTLKKRRHIWKYSDEKKKKHLKYIFSFKNQA